MYARSSYLTGLIFLLLAVPGCLLRNRARDGDLLTAVKVGDREYTRADLERYFESRLDEFGDPPDDGSMKSTLLEAFIDEKLLLQQAVMAKVEPAPGSVDALLDKIAASGWGDARDLKKDRQLQENLLESLKVQEFIRDYLLADASVSDEECRAYYEDHTADFYRKDVVHLREILTGDMEQALKVQASLKASRNKNFADLARLYSKAPTAFSGGDMGTFERGDLPVEFEKVVFPLAPGTISKIVTTQYGHHIFLVEEKILAHQPKYLEVRDRIHEKLLLEREREILDRELESFARQTPVDIHKERLGFVYSGTRFSFREGQVQ